jgi:hypothetical protein
MDLLSEARGLRWAANLVRQMACEIPDAGAIAKRADFAEIADIFETEACLREAREAQRRLSGTWTR